jgi:hypothetical protein
VQSAVGPFPANIFAEVINLFCNVKRFALLFKAQPLVTQAVLYVTQGLLIPAINKAGAAGLPLPTVNGITFVNPELVLGDGYIQIATDVTYSPSSSKRV